MRACSACGRDVHDEAYHESLTIMKLPPPIVGWEKGKPVRGEGEPARRAHRCRVRLIATSPQTGKRLAPASPHRVLSLEQARRENCPAVALDAKFVREDLLKGGHYDQ